MSTRIKQHVKRPAPIEVFVNDRPVSAYEGESLATALLASGVLTMTHDQSGKGRPKSPFCNMGVCFDCLVMVDGASVRACMTPVRAGLRVSVAEQ